MGKINYKSIYERNKDEWKALTREPQKYEALLAGHYSDSNHFVYELLQNAEDEHATNVVFEYYTDKLVFYHNGDPFDEDDVKGVSSMLMGTKDRNSAQTIGRFGMGFKSVFKYTYQPEIYSDDEAFRIENYLLPVEIDDDWDYIGLKDKLIYELNSGEKYVPFYNSKHLTKIIIPFKKKDHYGNVVSVSGEDVLNKLESIDKEILLFLTYIKKLYWIDKTSGKYAMITLDEKKNDKYLKTCIIEGTAYGKSEEIINYLKFTKKFDHPEMSNAEVSVAYRLNNRLNKINEIPETNIWVYFPTKDVTWLPFLIHGSFETAVSREKLMTPSKFNSDLFDKMGDLICESLFELRERKLITQVFLRRIIIAAFNDEVKNDTIPGLKEKITKLFLNENMLPDKNENYKHTYELSIAVPFGIADFFNKPIFEASFKGIKGFVELNNERESNFTEYYLWLKDDLHLNVFNLESWANKLRKIKRQFINIEKPEFNDLKSFYSFISDYRESINNTNLRYTRGGSYERTIKDCLSEAWKYLRKAPIILNANNELVPAYHKDLPNIYLNSSSEYMSVVSSAIVNTKISKEFMPVLTDGFNISCFNNYQYVKEKVINKYIKIKGSINFDNTEDYEKEYIDDIKQILKLIDETHNAYEIAELVKDAYIIKVVTDDDSDGFSKPKNVYVDTSDEGIDMTVYYAQIPKKDNEKDDADEEFDVYHLNTEFYNSHGISIKKLEQLGLITTPVTEGIRNGGGQGCEYWKALGEYCPDIYIDGLKINLDYIETNPENELAKKKSAEILKLLLVISEKLSGMVCHRKTSPYDKFEESFVLKTMKGCKWLYNKDEEICSTAEMSKYDLNINIYGGIIRDKEAYKRLGFIEKKDDNREDTFEMVNSLDKMDKDALLKELAKQLGMKVTSADELSEDEKDGVFNPNAWVSTEFPIRKVRNMDSLIEHVRQQFFCADPVTYKQILRQIRVSKDSKMVRAYTIGMYTNDENIKICQMCKKPTDQAEVTAISNFGIELNQLNLCLCRNCAGRYKMMRDSNKEKFKNQIKQAIRNLDIDDKSDEYEIELNSETSLYFTQTHIAEIQTILDLLDEYGLPNDEEQNREEVSCTLNNSKKNLLSYKYAIAANEKRDKEIHTITDGSYVEYKEIGTGECKKAKVNSKIYQSHKAFVGKNEGDIVNINGHKYKIINIL